MNFDPLESCPYDPVHRIRRSRMQTHLTKCAKNHPSSKKKQCPFDSRHLIDPVEFHHHVNTCLKRESVLHFAVEEKEHKKQLEKILPIESDPVVDLEENWEEDGEVKTYNPLQNIIERAVIRPLIGAPKSERKQFREQERLRLRHLETISVKNKAQQQAQAKATNAAKSIKMSNDDQAEQEIKPLRRPTTLPKLNKSGNISLNDSVSSIHNQSITTKQNTSIQHNSQVKNTVTLTSNNTSTQLKSGDKVNSNLRPKSEPPTYANIINKNTMHSNEKENLNTSSFLNNTHDESIIEKLSKTIEELAIDDEGHQKETESLSQQIQMLKKLQVDKNSTNVKQTKINKPLPNIEKKPSRCAANFPALN